MSQPLAVAPTREQSGFWNKVREEFPLHPDYLHFSQFFMVSHPRSVARAIERHRRALDEQPFLTVERGMFGSEEEQWPRKIYSAAARYLGGRENEVALVPNTTTGLALVYHGLPLGPGDEVLTSAHEHFTHHESIRLATARTGATWRKLNLWTDAAGASLTDILIRLRAAIRPETRVIGLTWVYSDTGLRLPVAEITRLVAELNRRRPKAQRICVVVDGTHGFGALEEQVCELGCDYFVSSAHKWLFGPRGTGVIWARESAWSRLRPVIPTYYTWDLWEAWAAGAPPSGASAPTHISPGGFIAYEHQWAMVEAFEFHERLGSERIAARIHQLNGRLMDLLESIPGVRLLTPRAPTWSAGIVCFEVEGMAPDEVVSRLLKRRVIASTSPYATPCARLSAGIMNTMDEVHAVAQALRAVVQSRDAEVVPIAPNSC